MFAQTFAEGVIGAVASFCDKPWVDPDRVVLLGLSAGGLAVTAAQAKRGEQVGARTIVGVQPKSRPRALQQLTAIRSLALAL